MPETRGRRALLRVASVLLAVLFAAGAAEALLRITRWGAYEPRFDDYQLLMDANERRYWYFDTSNPTVQAWDGDPYGVLPPGARISYALNSRGLRGPEPDPARPKVLFVGDSFTFGEGVEDEFVFPLRVEKLLEPRFRPPLQMIPAAVPGYGSEHEAARLPKWIGEFAPRAVVLVFVPNDPIPLNEEDQNGSLLIDRRDPPWLYLRRLAQSAFFHASNERALEDWYSSYYFGERRERWEQTRGEIAEMQKATTATGAKFAVVLFPLLHRLDERPFARIHEAVTSRCREIGAPVLDLSDALSVEPGRKLWVHPTDHHPNKLAHELAAKAIAPFVESLLR